MKFREMNTENLDSLMYSVNEWINGNRDCVYNIMDRLADYYIYDESFDAFSCLTAVCNNAEGKISDYLIDINGSFFYAKFGTYSKYLFFYYSRYKEEHCMINYLIAALSLQIAASGDEPSERQIITDHIDIESKRYNLSTEEEKYILTIYNRLKPEMWK